MADEKIPQQGEKKPNEAEELHNLPENKTEEDYDPYSWADEPSEPARDEIEEVEAEVEETGEATPQGEAEEPYYFTEADLPKFRPARALAEGALMAALAVLLGIIAYYVPVIGWIATFAWPIPLSFLILRQGMGWGILGTLITAAILCLFIGPLNGLILIINMAGVGIWYGYSFRKGVKPIKTLAVGAVISAVSAAIMVVLSNYVMGLPLTSIMEQLEKIVRQTMSMYQQAGLLNNLPNSMTAPQFTNVMIKTLKALLPGAFVVAAMAMAFISYLLTSAIFGRLGYRRHKLPRFREWHLSWVFLWGLIIAFAGLLGHRFWGYEWMKLLGMNVLYIYYPILLICGISLLAWFWPRWQGSALRAIVLISIVVFLEYALYALLLFGLIDTVFDIRKQVTAVEKQLKK